MKDPSHRMDTVDYWKHHKRCTKCGQAKPLSDFYTSQANKDKLTGQCKECIKTRVNAKRLTATGGSILSRRRDAREVYGILYILKNPVYPNYYKVGRAGELQSRLSTYNTADPHRAYTVIYERHSDDAIALDQIVLTALRSLLRQDGGEWFYTEEGEEEFIRKVRAICDAFDAANAPPGDGEDYTGLPSEDDTAVHDTHKTCTVCGETKPLDAFYFAPGYKDGRRTACIECLKKQNEARRQAKHAARVAQTPQQSATDVAKELDALWATILPPAS